MPLLRQVMNIFSGIFKLVKNLPQKPAIILCQTIVIIYLLFKKNYRAEIKANYQKIFGSYPKRFWLNQGRRIGKNLALMLHLAKTDKVLDKTHIYGENILCRLMKNNQKAVIVAFHYGVWELLPQIFQKLGYETWISIGAQRNRNLTNEISKVRNQNGVKTVTTVKEMKEILESNSSSNQKQLLGFVLDNTSKTHGIRLDEPWTGFRILRTPFILAKLANLPVLSMFCYQQNDQTVVDIDEIRKPQEVGARLKSYIEKNPAEWIFWGKNEKNN
jgi:lauroyl/myristoyl acyltransferase